MRHARLILFALTVLVLLLSAQPASACARCGFRLTCVVDECWLEEFCASRTRNNLEYCWVDWTGCHEDGDFCRWT